MNIEKFTTLSQQAISESLAMATSLQHSAFMPLHLLASLLADASGPARMLITRSGGDALRIAELTTTQLNRQPTLTGTQPQTGPKTIQVLTSAIARAETMCDSHVSIEHILVALSEVKSDAKEILSLGGISTQDIKII